MHRSRSDRLYITPQRVSQIAAVYMLICSPACAPVITVCTAERGYLLIRLMKTVHLTTLL